MADQLVQYKGIKTSIDTSRETAIDVTHETPLPVVNSTHMFSKGTIYGHEVVRKFGINSTVGTSQEFIGAGVTTESAPYMPTAATTIEAISTSADDDAAGTGARTIVVEGLDANFNRISETLTMNGLTATTASTQSFIRVTQVYVATVGTYGGNNAGQINVRVSSAGTRFLSILVGLGQGQYMHYCVPAGMKLFVKDVHITAETQKSSTVYFWQRQDADDVTVAYSGKRIIQQYIGLAGGYDFEYQPEIYIPALTDIWFTGVAASGTNAISVEINGILETV